MSIHRSFRSANRLEKHRNVLTRAERIQKLEPMNRWNEDEDSVFNLVKVRNIKVKGKKKSKEKDEEESLEIESSEE